MRFRRQGTGLPLIVLWLLAALPGSGKPQGHTPTQPHDDAKIIAHRFEDHYRVARTMRATFLQRYSEGPHDALVESGTVYFSRPGRMRWEYEAPESHVFVSDGKTIWSYVPSDHTATRVPVKESSDWRTPLALLTGKADLAKLCSRIELLPPPGSSPDNAVLRCLPKGEKVSSTPGKSPAAQNAAELPSPDDFIEVRIEVHSQTGQLANVEIRQAGSIILEYRFGGWQENIQLPDSLFRFKTPVGVAIVDGSALSDLKP